jgi:glycosyltransferase involved in cell wall biosynthesis
MPSRAPTTASAPVLFATGHLAPYRAGALAALHEREGLEVALFGGRHRHGGEVLAGELPFPARRVRQRGLAALAAGGRYRAVVCPTAGRVAPLALWAGARRARVPLILWASLWAHPRSLAHAFSYPALAALYRSADAVVTYGAHVSAYVQARGARNVHVAPQSVDNDFWRCSQVAAPPSPPFPARARVKFMFVGRPAPEKGLAVLLDAWHRSGLAGSDDALVIAGGEPGACGDGPPAPGGLVALGAVSPARLRDLYAACDVVVMPSIRTRTFREPWGLVANEAMNRGLPVIASDEVGAAAGALVRDGVNGLIVPAGDTGALAGALRRLSADRQLRERLGRSGARDVLAFDRVAWARGFSAALRSLGLSREPEAARTADRRHC